jgi:hypothetical protein
MNNDGTTAPMNSRSKMPMNTMIPFTPSPTNAMMDPS